MTPTSMQRAKLEANVDMVVTDHHYMPRHSKYASNIRGDLSDG